MSFHTFRKYMLSLASFMTMAAPLTVNAQTSGAALFEANCSSCHGSEGQGTFRGPRLAGGGYSPEFVQEKMNEGPGRMPSFSSLLDASAFEAISKHVSQLPL